MYKFKTELKKEMLEGRTITYLANQIGFSKNALTNILNGKNTTKKTTAYIISKMFNSDKEIEDYFTRED